MNEDGSMQSDFQPINSEEQHEKHFYNQFICYEKYGGFGHHNAHTKK